MFAASPTLPPRTHARSPQRLPLLTSTQAPEGKGERVGRCRKRAEWATARERGGGKLLGRYGVSRPSCFCALAKRVRSHRAATNLLQRRSYPLAPIPHQTQTP